MRYMQIHYNANGRCLSYCTHTKFIYVYNEEEEWHFPVSLTYESNYNAIAFSTGRSDSAFLLGWWMLAPRRLQFWKMRINKSVARRAICRGLHQFPIKQHRDVMSRSFQPTVFKLYIYDRLCWLSVNRSRRESLWFVIGCYTWYFNEKDSSERK